MDTDPAARRDLIARLFVLLTARAEDAAGVAADGQVAGDPEIVHRLANRLQDIGQEIATIAEALRTIAARA